MQGAVNPDADDRAQGYAVRLIGRGEMIKQIGVQIENVFDDRVARIGQHLFLMLDGIGYVGNDGTFFRKIRFTEKGAVILMQVGVDKGPEFISCPCCFRE